MYIEVNQIGPKGLMVDDSIALEETVLLEDDSFFLDNIYYKMKFSREGQKIKAIGSVETTISVPCVSCLEPFSVKVDSDFDIILFPVSQLNVSTASLEADDLEYIFFDGEQVDLKKILGEQVNLCVPFRPLCSDECRGLCPSCGTNLNNETCQCENSLKDVSFLFDKLKR